MDRLHETLDHRIEHWFKEEKKLTGKFLGLGKRPKMLKKLLVERMTVSYDLAAAFFYLHEHRYVAFPTASLLLVLSDLYS